MPVNVTLGWKLLTVTNSGTYNIVDLMTAVKSFIVQASTVNYFKEILHPLKPETLLKIKKNR